MPTTPTPSRRARHRSAVVLAALLAAAGSPEAQAQRASAGRDDGLAALRRDARQAQSRFEARRRQLLPWSRGSGGECDVTIGRYCYWYDEGGPRGPVEPARIADERRALLARLDAAARLLPGDDWIAGQRVRYWLEAGAADTALVAARECATTAWWCAALRGMALHGAADHAAAERAFDSALVTMPASEAARWRDVAPLLGADARRRWARLGGAARDTAEARFWWLADPFLALPGNDRRTEHFVRHVLSRLHTDARSPYGASWGSDLHELLLRYGWPERWSRRVPTGVIGGSAPATDVVGHEPVPSYRFTVDPAAADDVATIDADAWALRDPVAQERYTPGYARHLRPLAAEALVLRRADSLLVVAAYRLHGDSVLRRLASAPVRVALAAASSPHSVVIAEEARQGAAGALQLRTAGVPGLVGVEVRGDSGYAARWRAAVGAPPLVGGRGISGVWLFVPRTDADTTLSAALETPLVAGRTPRVGRIGIYWELYGLPPGVHALESTLVVSRGAPGRLRRAWDRVTRARAAEPVRLQWTDVVAARDAWTPRAMHLALPQLGAGSYEVELRVRLPGGTTVSSSHALVIEAR